MHWSLFEITDLHFSIQTRSHSFVYNYSIFRDGLKNWSNTWVKKCIHRIAHTTSIVPKINEFSLPKIAQDERMVNANYGRCYVIRILLIYHTNVSHSNLMNCAYNWTQHWTIYSINIKYIESNWWTSCKCAIKKSEKSTTTTQYWTL